jgi:hypothetical protein
MKPFNLEKALAGEPVVTRDGKPVTNLTLFPIKYEFPLYGVVEGDIRTYTKCGHRIADATSQTDGDLFMAPVKREGWVNILRNQSHGLVIAGARVFESKEQAAEAIYNDVWHVATVKVEWEE